MGTAYTRQSTLTDGDTITAALFNNEYNQLLTAFSYASSGTTGHQHDGTAGEGGNIAQIGDQDFLNKIVVDSSNNRWGFYVEVSSSAVEQIRVQDGAIVPVTDNDIDLGTSSLQFKDAFINGTLEADAITIAGVTLAETISDTVGAMVGSNTETGITVTYDDSDNTLDFVIGSGVIVSSMLDTNIDISGVATASTFEPDGDTAAGDNAAIGYTAAEGLILTGQGSTNDVTVKNDADTAVIQIPTGTTNVSIAGDLTVTGDLTVSGDDITMGTNTSGNLLVADGTNFNSVAVSSLSEISTVANDDVFLAIDTSGGGLKKIARSAVVSGLATSSAIANVVEDTTPQLGGDLDMNGQDIVTTSNADLELAPNGTGHVTVKGNTNAGAIQFNCESNSHGQIVKAQPHSAAVTNELLLPAGASSTLVSLVSTDTLSNKTLAAPTVTGDLTVDTSTLKVDSTNNRVGILNASPDVSLDIGSATDSLHVPSGTTAQRPGSPAAGYFRYNSTTGKFEGYTDAWGDIGGGEATITVSTMTGDGSDTTLTLSAEPPSENAVQVYFDGVYQHKDTFSISGTTLTFSTAPPSGVKVEAMNLLTVAASTTPADTSVTTAKLASNAVTTAKITDANVTTAKIADDAVTAAKLASSAVVTASIVDDNVTQAKIADDAVGADQLAASAVVTASMVDDAVTTAKIADDAITSALIADDAVVAAAIADNAVDIARLNVSDGSSGQVLTTNGSGTLSFATVSGAYNTWLVKTSAYTALVGDQIVVNSSSAVTITLPASASAGNTVIVKATGGGTVTLGRNSQNINSTAADGTLFSGNSVQLVYVDGTIGFLEI